jgi:hypothetical protein
VRVKHIPLSPFFLVLGLVVLSSSIKEEVSNVGHYRRMQFDRSFSKFYNIHGIHFRMAMHKISHNDKIPFSFILILVSCNLEVITMHKVIN